MAKEEPVSHENGEEETSKRRKHHHHHSRSHHRHRSKHRHSKHGKHKEDEHQLPSPAIRLDEKEEGEIFDDEIFDYEKLTKKADSEIESGEIKPDEESSDAKIDDSCVDQINGSDGDTLLGTPGNMLDLDQHQIDSRDQSPRGLPTLKEGNDDKDGTSDRIHGGFDGRDMMRDDNVSDGSPQMRILEESRKDVDIFADMNNGHLVSGNKGHTLKESDGGMELMNDFRKRDHLHDGFNHGVVSVGGNSEGEGWRDLSGNRNSTKSNNSLRKKDGHSGGGDIEASRSRGKLKESPEVEYKPRKHGELSPRAKKSNDVNGHSGGGDIEAPRLRGKVKESPEVEYKPRKHEESSPRIRKSNDVNGEIDHRSELHRHVGSKSKSPSRDDEKELFCRGSDSAIDGHSGSRSPRARERLDSKKNTNRDDRDAEPSSRRYDRKSADPVDINRDSSVNKNRSLSPESLRDKHKTRVRSPSYDRYHAEGRSRKRSRSHDRLRELIPQSRAVHSPERDSKRSKNSDRARPSDLRHHRFDDRENRHGSRDRVRDMDRERLRDRGIGRYRERSSSYNRLTGEDTLDGRDRDMDRGRDRDRNRDRDAPLDRDRDRERAKDGDRGREMQRDRDRERDWERNRDRDGNAASRRHKYDDHDFNHGGRDRFRNSGYRRYDELEYERDRPRKKESANDLGSKRHNTEVGKEKAIREEDEQEDYQERVVLQLAEHEEEDVNRIKEESRKRRQAILEKYKQQQSQVQVESFPQDDGKDEKEPGVDRKPRSSSSIEKSPTIHPVNHALPESIDNKHDSSDIYVADPSFTVGKSPLQNETSAVERTSGAGGLGEGSPKSEISKDMFCDDIFGESPAGVRKLAKGDGLHVERSGLHDNWDDAEGYYSYRIGEVLDGRYEVTAAHGKGVFSTVVRATDLKAGKTDPEEVAIKIIRNNETMYKAGLEELIILKKLVGADPDDKRHCVKFLSSFKYRNHLCLVFESLHMNLRDVLKKFGRNIGLKLTAVRAYAKQLFIALKHLRNCGVLHCDIKPDNMLVNEAKNVLKLCDFGNAMFAGKNEITPYLVSRFYRAPEIILGLPYDHPMDVWSVGCCLYELYLGKVLFPGPSNNEMLRLHMELKGPFPKKMLKKGAFCDQHFDQDLNFYATEEDSITKKAVKRLLINIKPKYIGSLISGSPGEDPKMLADFKDLLERIFVLDPEKRMTVSQALNHPFITGK